MEKIEEVSKSRIHFVMVTQNNRVTKYSTAVWKLTKRLANDIIMGAEDYKIFMDL